MSPEELMKLSESYFTKKKITIIETLDEAKKKILKRLEYELTVVDLM
jgi:hypothetical protein